MSVQHANSQIAASKMKSSSTGKLERRKIWELPQSYVSLLLSLAMSSKEVTRAMRYHPEAQEKTQVTEVMMISELSNAGNCSKLVAKQLDKKYKTELRKFQLCKSEEELLGLWRQYLEGQDIAAGFWGILTHALSTEEFLAEGYWQLSQLLASQTKLLARNKDVQHELEDRLQGSEQRLAGMTALLEQTQEDQLKIQALQRQVNKLSGRQKNSSAAVPDSDYRRMYKEANKELKKFQYEYERQNQRIAELELLILKQSQPTHHDDKLHNLNSASSNASECSASEKCSELCQQQQSNWEESLHGRNVLYVGGRTRQVARLRKMVEVHGGRFVHHDGGLHDGFSRLKEVVDCADVVLCPLNCISHNASGHIKKCCKQANKPLCFLRTSGVSAFNEGLKKAIETNAVISMVS